LWPLGPVPGMAIAKGQAAVLRYNCAPKLLQEVGGPSFLALMDEVEHPLQTKRRCPSPGLPALDNPVEPGQQLAEVDLLVLRLYGQEPDRVGVPDPEKVPDPAGGRLSGDTGPGPEVLGPGDGLRL